MNDKKDNCTNKKNGCVSASGGSIWVNEFTEHSAMNFCDAIFQAAEDPTTPIVVYIDSFGGMVDSLSVMVAALESVSNPIFTVGVGKAMSCGAILLSCGDTRFVAPHCRVLVHEISGGALGNVNDNVTNIKEQAKLNTHFMEILAKNCGFASFKELRLLFTNENRELYLSPKEALKFGPLGIADVIGFPRLIRNNNWSLISNKHVKPVKDCKGKH